MISWMINTLFEFWKKNWKILETAQNRIRNARDFITSLFVSSFVNHIAKMIANINASNRFEKTKRLIVISNSTIFIENKTKLKHWLSIMQSKFEANVDWYSIERMTMIYVNIRFDEETYKHISTRLNKNFSRKYLIVNEIFEDLKRVYVDFNKMQTTINAFVRLIQINKYVEFHMFWNEFQRFMTKMNLLDHFLLIELKKKMFYRLQNVMFSEFNIIQNIYELARLIQLKNNHYKRINDVKSRKWSNAIVIVVVEIDTKIAISRTMNIITTSISINERIESIFAESRIWNFNQYHSSNFRMSNISRTFNFDSIKEKFIKTHKCFNYNESNHLNRDCSKKFKIVEMNVKDDTKKLNKK
jgi:hypothetical protein